MRDGKDTAVTQRTTGADDPKIKDQTRGGDDKRQPNPMDEGFVFYED